MLDYSIASGIELIDRILDFIEYERIDEADNLDCLSAAVMDESCQTIEHQLFTLLSALTKKSECTLELEKLMRRFELKGRLPATIDARGSVGPALSASADSHLLFAVVLLFAHRCDADPRWVNTALKVLHALKSLTPCAMNDRVARASRLAERAVARW